MDPSDQLNEIVDRGLIDPVAERCVRLAARVRFLERRLEHQLRVNSELETARKRINQIIREMRKAKK